MIEPRLKRYSKDFEYSYSFGVYPTKDLIKYRPESVLKVLVSSDVSENDKGDVEDIVSWCEEKGVPFSVNDRAIEKIAYKENTYVIGIFQKYEEGLDKNEDHLVLVEPRNMGNIGTIIRTMKGFNFNNLAIVRPAVDIFDPKVVRSTMGALFQIKFKYFDSIEEYIEGYGDHNVYTFMLNGKKEIRDVVFNSPFTLIHGNESKGLDDRYLDLGDSVVIDHSDDIDSLNLAIATGITLWESRK
jgi:RNA methyltransferase, TrmH family